MKEFLFKNRKIFVFTSVVIMFLVGVGVIQIIMNQMKPFEDTPVVKVEKKEEEKQTADSEEVLKAPVTTDVKIARYFYDPSYDDKKLEESLVYFEGVYRPNLGIDYTKDGTAFDVMASISGTVTKKTNDPLLGWVVTITGDNGIATTYQSLSNVSVEEKAKVKQGDKVGVSGENVYESDLKNHLHFIVESDNIPINPESSFDQLLSKVGK